MVFLFAWDQYGRAGIVDAGEVGHGDIMNIVYALTRNFYPRLLPSIRSLLEHNPDARIYILAEDDEVLDLPCKATVINVSEQKYFPHTGPNYWNAYTYINLLKVCYPEYLPRLNKVIHLDVDTIICDSLEGLWKTDVKGKWFAACQEIHGIYKPFGEKYYNMGVALINLQQMRKDGIVPKMVEYLNAFRQPWADQDAWNRYAIEQGKAAELDVRYNEAKMTGMTENPAVVHYCGFPSWWDDKWVPRHELLEQYK